MTKHSIKHCEVLAWRKDQSDKSGHLVESGMESICFNAELGIWMDDSTFVP